jgi:hypothetical protein
MNDASRDAQPGWGIGLKISFALNLFLAALICGHLLRAQMHKNPEISLARALANASASLSEPDAAKFNAVMQHNAPMYADALKRLADARLELRRQISAEPFDSNASRQAFAQWQLSLGNFNHDIGDTLVDALAVISPEGRSRILAARFQAPPGSRTDANASGPQGRTP